MNLRFIHDFKDTLPDVVTTHPNCSCVSQRNGVQVDGAAAYYDP